MIISDIETTEKVEYEDLLKNYYEKMEIIEEQDKEIERLTKRLEEAQLGYLAVEEKNKRLHSIIKEVREYITSYESIETIQQFDHNKNNEDLDYSTIDEMTRRYMMVHDKILKILDKEVISNE